MVHALKEVRRVLAAAGELIDLRPVADRWIVEVVSARGSEEAVRLTDLKEGLAYDAAANEAMAQGETAGWFRRGREEFFPLHYVWDSPKEMHSYVEEEWADFTVVGEDVWQKIRSTWGIADADARVRVRAKMLITRWSKVI